MYSVRVFDCVCVYVCVCVCVCVCDARLFPILTRFDRESFVRERLLYSNVKTAPKHDRGGVEAGLEKHPLPLPPVTEECPRLAKSILIALDVLVPLRPRVGEGGSNSLSPRACFRCSRALSLSLCVGRSPMNRSRPVGLGSFDRTGKGRHGFHTAKKVPIGKSFSAYY